MNQIKTLPTKKSPELVYEGKAQASLDPVTKQRVYMKARVIRHRCQDTGGGARNGNVVSHFGQSCSQGNNVPLSTSHIKRIND
jgi:hypothetical protein